MKKLFTLITAVLVSLATMATTYTGTLTVTVNGEGSTQDNVNIDIVKEDGGTYELTLKNFILDLGGQLMPVGNIQLTNITGNNKGYVTALKVDQDVEIQNGDDPNVEMWMGPYLGVVPLKMFAYFDTYENHGNYLEVDIDINMMETLGQVINVHFENARDNDFSMLQHENSDFESWSGTNAATGWTGFESASGNLQSMIQKSTYLTRGSSTEAHSGNYCAKASSYKGWLTLKIYANGTFTNGRLNAGATSAGDAANNYSYMVSPAYDTSAPTNYHPILVAPDAISAWLKLNSTVPTDNPANFSVILFDGTRYQDPESDGSNKDNVAAKAQDKTSITRTNGYDSWKQNIVPFTYTDVSKAKAILITFSTSATPGGVSSSKNGETIYVDDIELHYYNRVTDIQVNGTTLAGFGENTHEYNIEIGLDDVITDADISASFVGVSAVTGWYVNENADGTGYTAVVYAISPKVEMNKYVINFNYKKTAIADVLEGESAKVRVADDLAIASVTDDGDIYATDGTSWVRLHFDDEMLFNTVRYSTSLVGGSVMGEYTASAIDPVVNVSKAMASDEEVVYDILPLDLANTTDWNTVKPNQVMTITGYYFDGKLRAFSGNNGNKGASIDLDFGSSDAATRGFSEGAYVKTTAAITMHEAWSGAPRRANSSYDYDFQNLVAKVLTDAEDATTTAVTDITTDAEVVSTRYFNVEGRELAEPAQGVTIVVTTHSDGTVKATKVLK